jgi:hypothetical protein
MLAVHIMDCGPHVLFFYVSTFLVSYIIALFVMNNPRLFPRMYSLFLTHGIISGGVGRKKPSNPKSAFNPGVLEKEKTVSNERARKGWTAHPFASFG